jgi:hypothetical protein
LGLAGSQAGQGQRGCQELQEPAPGEAFYPIGLAWKFFVKLLLELLSFRQLSQAAPGSLHLAVGQPLPNGVQVDGLIFPVVNPLLIRH